VRGGGGGGGGGGGLGYHTRHQGVWCLAVGGMAPLDLAIGIAS
jgi:hypothetical protein